MKSKQFIPERLIEAREIRGYTKADLARFLSVSRQAISQFEKGTTQPGSSTLIALTRILRVPLDYFFTIRPRESTRTSPIYFRKRNAATKISRIQGSRFEEWFADINEYLLRYFDFPEIRILDYSAEPSSIVEDDIEEIALSLRQHWGLGQGPISNMTRLVENNGFMLGRTKLSGLMDSYSCWRTNGRANIIITNSAISSVRYRFDIAHELGHLVLHRHIDEHEFEAPENHKLFEDQANAFASAFLMPANAFAKDFLSASLDALIYLKKRWLVSIQAIALRCFNLSLISESQKDYVFKKLSLMDGRKKEPLDNEIPIEVPVLLSRSLQILIEKGIATQEQLLSDLNLPVQELADLSNLNEDIFNRDNVTRLELKDSL